MTEADNLLNNTIFALFLGQFEKVGCVMLLYKLSGYSISGIINANINSLHSSKIMYVVLNGQSNMQMGPKSLSHRFDHLSAFY